MSDVIELIKCEIYYYVAFYDRKLSIPCIKTYIYDGYENDHGFLFRSAAGHATAIDDLIIDVVESDIHYIAYEDESLMYMLDKQRLIEWLNEEHSPQQIQKPIRYKYESTS